MSVAIARFLRAGGLPLVIPVLIAGGFAIAAAVSPSRPVITFDPATAWLVSARGAVVRANALVGAGPAQIVDSVAADSARRSVGLLSVAGKVIVVGAGGDATIVDPAGAPPVTVEGGSFAVSGARLYRIGRDTVDLFKADLRTVAAHYDTGRITAAQPGDGAMYVAGPGGLRRIDDRGMSPLPGAGSSRLAAVDGGVAAWNPAAGTVALIRGTEVRRTIRNAALRTDDAVATFGVTPDGNRVAVRADEQLTVVRGGAVGRLAVDGTATPELLGDRIYLGQPDGLRVFDARPAPIVTYPFAPAAVLDVHREGRFLWYDDVRGPFAYAVHAGRITRVVKYTASTRTPATRPTARTTTKPTTVPNPSPTKSPSVSPAPRHSHTSVPKPTPTPNPSPKPKPEPKPKPKPTTKASPAPDCHGDDTLLTVNHREHTGDHPSGTVTICHAARGSTEYWIISRVVSEGDVLWYAKTQVSGDRSEPFSFRLYADAATQGDRDYVVVAARTGAARTWLQNNLDADRTQGAFDFNDLPDGIDEISARVHSAT